jgi:hypothetical protein
MKDDLSRERLPPASLPLVGEAVTCMQDGIRVTAPAAAFGIPVASVSAPPPLAPFQPWIDESAWPPTLRIYVDERWVALYAIGDDGTLALSAALGLHATTITDAPSPSTAGRISFHSDAQEGLGELAVDTGTAWRHAGQAAVRTLNADADTSYAPRLDGRIVRDAAALTADRALTLSNATDGYRIDVTRRTSSGGRVRNIYQQDGTTLIAALADGTSASFVYDATGGAWFQL